MLNKIIRKIGLDKILHFTVSFTLATTLFLVNVWFGIVFVLVIGLLKEISDSLEDNNKACWQDLFFNVLGILAAYIVFVIK